MTIPDESITYSSGGSDAAPPDLRFIHYNDVYHIEPSSREPCGGMARFKTVCDAYRRRPGPEVVTFFSGDAFSPSLESSITKGKHMVGALNSIGTDVACLGNHELDFGVEQFQHLAAQCEFPWLCANVLDPALGDEVPLGRCKRTTMLRANGITIGVIGLVEREWLETVNALPPGLQYLSASATAAALAPRLRAQGAEMIVCICHQREHNDFRLADLVPAGTIDIILGGHDHFYGHAIVNRTHVLRSGTDFKNLSYIEARRRRAGDGGWDFHIVRRDVTSAIEEDAGARAELERITGNLRPKLEKTIGFTAVPLDGRSTTVRTGESNLGNFVCDLMQRYYEAECCLMCAGTMRGDRVYPAGALQVRDIMGCFPFEDPCVVLGVRGSDILGALENGVSRWPSQEGRFPQVSGIRFAFDPARPAGGRCVQVQVAGQALDLEREYIMATRDYMACGKDGYTHLVPRSAGGNARTIVGDESGLLISTMLRQYFLSLKAVSRWKSWDASMERHWSRIQEDLHQVHPVRGPAGDAARAMAPAARRGSTRSPREQQQEEEDQHQHQHQQVRHDTGDDDGPARRTSPTEAGTEVSLLMRRMLGHWRRAARMPGRPHLHRPNGDDGEDGGDDGDGDASFGVGWTKAVAPRIEGRIRMVGSG